MSWEMKKGDGFVQNATWQQNQGPTLENTLNQSIFLETLPISVLFVTKSVNPQRLWEFIRFDIIRMTNRWLTTDNLSKWNTNICFNFYLFLLAFIDPEEVYKRMSRLPNGHYHCTECDYKSNRKNNVTRHIVTRHNLF